LVLLLAESTPLRAATEERALYDLDSLIEEALLRNPQVQAMEARWLAAKERVPQASSLPDPTLGYTVMGPMLETRLGPQKDMYEFEQMIPFPGKLAERRKMASAETQAAEAQLNRTKQDLILKISQVYWDLYGVQASLKTTEDIRELLNQLEGIAQARYASQQGSQRDVAKAQAEVSDILQRMFVLRQQKQTLLASLKSLLNSHEEDFDIGEISSPEIPAPNLSLSELLEHSKANRPELWEAAALEKRETHAEALSKYEYAPDISVGFQYFKIGEGDTSEADDGRDAWMVPIKFTIPLWQNRVVPALQEAKKNRQAAQETLRDTENSSEFEVKNAYYQFTTAKQIIDLYENALIPQVEMAFQSDKAGYESGQTDVLNLVDSERVYLNSKLAYYQAVSEALKNFAMLERAVGLDLETLRRNSP